MFRIKKWLGMVLLAAMLSVGALGCGENVGNANEPSTGAQQNVQESNSGEDQAAPEDAAAGQNDPTQAGSTCGSFDLSAIPAYSGNPYVAVNDNNPYFTEEELAEAAASFETYSDLDALGRCGVCTASVGTDLMPTEERGNIGSVKPTGWHTVKYDFVDGKYLYNRCHLIGFQLTGENANEKNLITGTRYLNVDGMLPFENMVADYVKETNQHVLYRVTPVFTGENRVAEGVLMEGKSVEDNGEGILFCVFAYNVQPGVSIDYATGESVEGDPAERSDSSQSQPAESGGSGQAGAESEPDTFKEREAGSDNSAGISTYILNTSTMKFHREDCSSVKKMSEKNRAVFEGTRQEVIDAGYAPCENCNP